MPTSTFAFLSEFSNRIPRPRLPSRPRPSTAALLRREGSRTDTKTHRAYGCPQGYTPLMSACHRGRLECAKALLRSGADPNYMNGADDLTMFWAVDGGVEVRCRVPPRRPPPESN